MVIVTRRVAQLVEHNLVKVGVAGSNCLPLKTGAIRRCFFHTKYDKSDDARVVELVDTPT